MGNFTNTDVDNAAGQAKKWRQNGDKNPGIEAIEENLKEAVKGDQASGILGIAMGQLVPDDHHRNTAGQPNHDQPNHIFRVVAQEKDCQQKHQHRPNQPVLDQGEAQNFSVAKNFAQLFILHLGKRGIHHQDQPDGDGNVGCAHLKAVDQRFGARDEIAGGHPHGHRQKDPKCEKTV